MAGPTLAERVRDRLEAVVDPCSAAQGYHFSVVEMGLVDDVTVESGHVTVSLRLTSPTCMMVDRFVAQIDEEVGSLPAVESVGVETDDGLSWAPSMMSDAAREKRRERLDGRADEVPVTEV